MAVAIEVSVREAARRSPRPHGATGRRPKAPATVTKQGCDARTRHGKVASTIPIELTEGQVSYETPDRDSALFGLPKPPSPVAEENDDPVALVDIILSAFGYRDVSVVVSVDVSDRHREAQRMNPNRASRRLHKAPCTLAQENTDGLT
jgi:hypothetical protein